MSGERGPPPPPPRGADDRGPRAPGSRRGLRQEEPPPHWELEGKQHALRSRTGHGLWHNYAAREADERRERMAQAEDTSDAAGGANSQSARELRQRHMSLCTLAIGGPGIQRFVHYVLGRPTMYLVLSHPGMAPEETTPYHSTVLAPAPVVTILGRTATRAPACPRHEVVFHNWRDVILPLILSPALPADLLVVVMEADFRLSKDHADACRAYEAGGADGWTWRRGQHADFWEGQDAAAMGAKGSNFQSARGRQGKSAGKGRKLPTQKEYSWKDRHVPVEREPLQNPILEQLVGLVNQAHKRFGRGDLVWFSWLGAKTKGALMPSRASTCIALTRGAAATILTWIHGPARDARHFDVLLADGLSQRVAGLEELCPHACFLSPSRGGFQGHLSGCEANLQREEEWDRGRPWLSELSAGNPMWYATWGFKKWNNECWLGEVVEDAKKCLWLTYQPPELRGAEEEKQQFLSAALGQPHQEWVEAEFDLAAAAEAQAAAMGAAQAADPEASVVALAAGPDLDEVDWDDACSVCSVADADEEAAAALLKRRKLEAGLRQHPKRRATRPEPVDEAFIGSAVEKTKHRVQQRRKAVLRYYRFRHFTYDKARPAQGAAVNFQSCLHGSDSTCVQTKSKCHTRK